MKAGVSQQAARAAGFLGSRMWFISKTWLLWSSVANAHSLTWTWGDEHCGSSSWRHTVYKIPSYLPPNLLRVRALEVSPRCYPHLIAEDIHILFTEKKKEKKKLLLLHHPHSLFFYLVIAPLSGIHWLVACNLILFQQLFPEGPRVTITESDCQYHIADAIVLFTHPHSINSKLTGLAHKSLDILPLF